MPLHILALLVVFGLAAIIAAVHFSGGSRNIPPMTAEQACERFMQDHQTFDLADCHVADDGRTALIFAKDRGQGGLVLQMGDRLVTRRLGPELLTSVTEIDNGLHLALQDFTLPRATIFLATQANRQALAQRLEPLTGGTA